MERNLSLKLVVVGDGNVGKTMLLYTIHSGSFENARSELMYHSRYPRAPMLDIKLDIDGKDQALSLWDTLGQDDYDRLRPLIYPNTDVFLICFSVDYPKSLANVRRKWLPEVLHFRSDPNVPYILVGCKTDLRDNQRVLGAPDDAGLKFVSPQEGEAMAQEIGAAVYLECSSLTGAGVRDVFENASREAFRAPCTPRRPRQRKCIPL